MSALDTTDAPTLSDEETEAVLQRLTDKFAQETRSPILHSPSEQGLQFEDVTFPSLDGVPLEGWFIPAPGSDKVIIANHPLGFSRSGMPSHLEPWKSTWSPSGNDFEVDFVPDLKILHDAGYNVLAYDLRNFGHSGAANGGILTSGIFESRDVIGSLRYIRGRLDTQDMTVGLFSRCLGCDATFYAMQEHPGAFAGVRCLVGPQPLTTKTATTRQLELAGVSGDWIDELEQRVVLHTSIGFAQMQPTEWVKGVHIPTFLYQVHDDLLTNPSDVRTMFDNIPVADKKLQWIYGTTARWDGYLEFQRRPQPMLDWFEQHMT